jgi:sugar-phosphatase
MEIFPEVGITLTPELCRRTMGLRIDEVVDHWYSEQPWDSPSREELARRVVARVGDLIRSEGTLLPGAREALTSAGLQGRLALASSSFYELIDAVVDGFGVRSYFEVVYSAEDEPYGKPHPGIYLTVAGKLGIEPTRCVAIEDSPNGILAAKAARMRCVAIPEIAVAGDPRIALADEVIGGLTDIDEGLWARLARPSAPPRN